MRRLRETGSAPKASLGINYSNRLAVGPILLGGRREFNPKLESSLGRLIVLEYNGFAGHFAAP